MNIFITYNKKDQTPALRLHTIAAVSIEKGKISLPDRSSFPNARKNTNNCIEEADVFLFFGRKIKKRAQCDIDHAYHHSAAMLLIFEIRNKKDLIDGIERAVQMLENNKKIDASDKTIVLALVLIGFGMAALHEESKSKNKKIG